MIGWRAFFITCILGACQGNLVNAQLSYVFDLSIPIEQNGKQLKDPWAGGLNSVQYNQLDLDDDGSWIWYCTTDLDSIC